MPEIIRAQMVTIAEPELAMRETMDELKLDELAQSMAREGLLQPIGLKVLRTADCGCDCHATAHQSICGPCCPGRYEIVFGHRRYCAARKLGWTEINATVLNGSKRDNARAMFSENFNREDVNPAAVALWLRQLIDEQDCTEADLLAITGRNVDWINDRLRLFEGDEEVFNALRADKINFSVARELNKCKDEAARRQYLDCALQGGVNARTVARWVHDWKLSLIPAGQPVVSQPDTAGEMPIVDAAPTCFYCHAQNSPFNMKFVHVHDWCADNAAKLLKQSARVD